MGSAVLGDLLAEGHGHGSRPQHRQECDDGTHCLLEALATYIPREDFFFFLIQSNLATGSIVQYLLGKDTAVHCPCHQEQFVHYSRVFILRNAHPGAPGAPLRNLQTPPQRGTLRQSKSRHSWNGRPSKAGGLSVAAYGGPSSRP